MPHWGGVGAAGGAPRTSPLRSQALSSAEIGGSMTAVLFPTFRARMQLRRRVVRRRSSRRSWIARARAELAAAQGSPARPMIVAAAARLAAARHVWTVCVDVRPASERNARLPGWRSSTPTWPTSRSTWQSLAAVVSEALERGRRAWFSASRPWDGGRQGHQVGGGCGHDRV